MSGDTRAVAGRESDFDPERSWQALEDRIARESEPRRRQLLCQVRDHVRSEIRGQLEELMATLCDDPRYHFWGVGPEVGPKGRAAVESFYRQMIEGGGNRFEFEIRRIVLDEDAVVTEGAMRTLVPGDVVAATSDRVNDEPVDREATYVSEMQILTVWPATADGRLVGEDIYFGSQPMTRLSKCVT